MWKWHVRVDTTIQSHTYNVVSPELDRSLIGRDVRDANRDVPCHTHLKVVSHIWMHHSKMKPQLTTALLHTVTHCNTLQHTATHCNTLRHTATHCNTLQHTATHCNTPFALNWSQPCRSWSKPLAIEAFSNPAYYPIYIQVFFRTELTRVKLSVVSAQVRTHTIHTHTHTHTIDTHTRCFLEQSLLV